MSNEAARLEALGEPVVRFRWRGHDLAIPRPLESWPLDTIRAGEYVDAVAILLDGQTAPVPLYRDLVSLSDAMAAAVGVERLPESPPRDDKIRPIKQSSNRTGKTRKAAGRKSRYSDPLLRVDRHILGAVPTLLGLLDAYEDDIASDLKRFWNVDYADRWRGALTLRQIWTYIRRSQPNSSLAVAQNGGNELWTKQAVITAQVWERLAGKPYTGRPMTQDEIDAALADLKAKRERMDTLAAKQDQYGPEASQARRAAWEAKKAARAAGGAPPADIEPPASAMAALDKAMANRQRDILPTGRAFR